MRRFVERLLTREVLVFLGVGGAGYVVDVVVFTALLGWNPTRDPFLARLVAVAAAMVVTYVGNATFTWRGTRQGGREVALFTVFNAVGLGISMGCLWVSHDLMGLTSALADNVSANVVGLALGTLFRYVTYRRWVFAADDQDEQLVEPVGQVVGRRQA